MSSTQVFIQTAFLGDVLLSVPFLKNWSYLAGPDVRKILVCRKGVGALIQSLGLVDQVIEIEKGNAKSYGLAAKILNEIKIELVISAHQSFRTLLFVRKIRAQRKIGYRSIFSFFSYGEVVERNLKLPEPLRLLQLLSPMDPSLQGLFDDYLATKASDEYGEDLKLSSPPHWAQPNLKANIQAAVDPIQVMKKFNVSESLEWIAIFPGSVWETKRWTEAGFQAVVQDLLQRGFGVLLFGGPEERGLCEAVSSHPSVSVHSNRILNLAGKSNLLETLGLLGQCKMALTNDSAGAHLASLTEIKVLTIFGPTVLEFGYRPWANKTFIIEQKDLFCRPCGSHGHKKCPLDTHECMKSIRAEEVISVLNRVLASK